MKHNVCFEWVFIFLDSRILKFSFFLTLKRKITAYTAVQFLSNKNNNGASVKSIGAGSLSWHKAWRQRISAAPSVSLIKTSLYHVMSHLMRLQCNKSINGWNIKLAYSCWHILLTYLGLLYTGKGSSSFKFTRLMREGCCIDWLTFLTQTQIYNGSSNVI